MVLYCIVLILFYRASRSICLSEALPTTGIDTVSEFTRRSDRQLRVKDLPKVPTWRLERDSNPRPFGRRASTHQCATTPHIVTVWEKNRTCTLWVTRCLFWPMGQRVPSSALPPVAYPPLSLTITCCPFTVMLSPAATTVSWLFKRIVSTC